MEITIQSIATVYNNRKEISDDFWGDVISEIRLNEDIPESAFDGIEDFSHLEIFYIFHKATAQPIVYTSEHPRENKAWPKVGIYAQRKKNRPNLMGATICELIKREGRSLFVKRLDALDNTPVIDIKPIMQEFLPVKEIRQPDWSSELMKNYWK